LATGMWTAAAGAAAQSQNVEIIANNLANSDTPAFKKDLPTFKEYLATIEREHGTVDIPRGPIKEKEFYPLDGRDESFVIMDGTHTNHLQGHLRVTQSALDVALDGPGFLEVSTPFGVRYTRHGSLKLATDGRLVTTEGYPVLTASPGGLAAQTNLPNQSGGQGRQPANVGTQGGVQAGLGANLMNDPAVAGRFISLRDRGTQFSINTMGEIYAGENLIGKLSVVEFNDLNKIRKQGGHLFENRDPNNYKAGNPGTQVRQGVLETSNVNPIEEMTNLIKANRLFEHDLKALKTYGDLLGKEANDIGKL